MDDCVGLCRLIAQQDCDNTQHRACFLLRLMCCALLMVCSLQPAAWVGGFVLSMVIIFHSYHDVCVLCGPRSGARLSLCTSSIVDCPPSSDRATEDGRKEDGAGAGDVQQMVAIVSLVRSLLAHLQRDEQG
jgi:hypothetical protein